MTFWRVVKPPLPSSMPSRNTGLFQVADGGIWPGKVPVICTSRMKGEPLATWTGVLQVTPSSVWVTNRAPPPTLKLFQEMYMRPYAELYGELSTHMDSRSSALLLWAQAEVVQVWPSEDFQVPMP